MVHEALKALVERESMRHLAAGGSEPGAEAPPRRRTKPG
jgi:hypothetical protein